jgi:cytochrome c-type protein NapB
MSVDTRPQTGAASARLWMVGGTMAAAVAVVGFVTGLRQHHAPLGFADRTPPDGPAAAQPAPRHVDLTGIGWSTNRQRLETNLSRLAAETPGITPPSSDARAAAADPASPEARKLELAERAALRAYDGAPPVIPHPVVEQDTRACLVCHADGLKLPSKRTPAVGHSGERANCLQCHALAAGGPGHSAAFRPVPERAPLTENTFVGQASPAGGDRAWDGAPPVIPHATNLRERCTGCHGNPDSGIRSSHPWRLNCEQCHAASAALDQRAPVALDARFETPPPGAAAVP